ncbi:MAG: hypothetical protein AAF328_09075, partial [Planctomycetota bacterium]
LNSPAFTLRPGDLDVLLLPQAVDTIKAGRPTDLQQLGGHPFTSKPWTGIDDPTHRLDQRPIRGRPLEPVPLRAPRLGQRPTRPALTYVIVPQTATDRF